MIPCTYFLAMNINYDRISSGTLLNLHVIYAIVIPTSKLLDHRTSIHVFILNHYN